MKDLKIGLALGSGGAKGLAHIGILKALKDGGIPIHVIAGTSIGTVVGGSYCTGLSLEKLTEFAVKFGKTRLTHLLDTSFFTGGGLLRGSKIEQSLKELTGPCDIADLKTPFYAVATDLATGKEVVISKGDLHHATRASFAIPGIFSPSEFNGRWLVDGALIAPIPTRVLRDEAKCDVIIAVNAASTPEDENMITSDYRPSLLDVLMQTLSITQRTLAKQCMAMADISITPYLTDYKWTDFSRALELIDLGYDTAIKGLPTIKKVIASKRRGSIIRRLFS